MNRDDFIHLLNADQWSNAACMGYVIKACKRLNYSKEEISSLLKMLSAMFTNYTTQEAEAEYREY